MPSTQEYIREGTVHKIKTWFVKGLKDWRRAKEGEGFVKTGEDMRGEALLSE
jgi:hypothetical protein